jgi:hypothetical protein
MMKRIVVGLATLLLGVVAVHADAAFHLFRIDQVYSSADSTVQYVVLRESTGSNGENFWAGHTLETTSAGGAQQQFVFLTGLPSSATASRRVLVATAGFAALGLVAPDYVVPNGFIPRGGGKVDYASGTDEITFTALPTDGATAFNRNGQPVAATPTNFAGATTTLTPTTPPPPAGSPDLNQHGLTGSWFEAATSGHGIEIEVFPNLAGAGVSLVQGAWFTFDGPPAGGADRERWYTFNGPGQSGGANVPVKIFQNVGGNFGAAPITQGAQVGTGTLTFADCSNATLSYAFPDGSGRAGSIALTRLTPNVTCTVGTAPATNADFALSGNWFDASTSGQGFVLDVNPVSPAVFLTWYTYAPAGQALGAAGQRWFVGLLKPYTVGSRAVTLPLFETTGGLFDQPSTPAPASVPVGTATVTFASCSSAQVSYNFTSGSSAGRTGAISLIRVGPIPPGCTLAATDIMPPPMMCSYGYCYPGG